MKNNPRNRILGLVISIVMVLSMASCQIIEEIMLLPTTSATISPTQQVRPTTAANTIPVQISSGPALPNIASVVAKVRPSVVAINVDITTYDIFRGPASEKGAGSGWILNKQGYIVTNNHVVEGAQKVTVSLADGRDFVAEDIRTDPFTDIAVLRISADNLVPADVGDPSRLNVGDWVTAMGNSLGMGISATNGIVSALAVTLESASGEALRGLIQTDAAINPGNSGGPLVDMSGGVVGINSMKIAEVGVEGMGYAISVSEALPVINELISTGYVVRPSLGIGMTTVNRVVARWYGLSQSTGVLVIEVVRDGAADRVGIKVGDVITALDGKNVASEAEFTQAINASKVGQQVSVTYYRGRSQNIALATLAQSLPSSQ
jgi:serine protease Do